MAVWNSLWWPPAKCPAGVLPHVFHQLPASLSTAPGGILKQTREPSGATGHRAAQAELLSSESMPHRACDYNFGSNSTAF